MSAEDPKAEIRSKALALGFDAVGFAPAELGSQAAEGLRRFLADGRHGDMGWLEARAEQRSAPRALWPEARSVIVLGQNYGPALDPMETLNDTEAATISVYARNRDYHDLVKKRLKALGRWMAGRYGCALKVFVDTAPVMEKPLAERAGLGWQGKHSNLVSRDFGSWLFLGEVFTDMALAPDTAETDHCGSCRACLDICPTDAFPAPYQLDARRCISYLTIESKGPIPREFRAAMGNRIYGCRSCPDGAGGPDRPAPRGARPVGRRGLPRTLFRQPHQAQRAQPIPAKCLDRPRQQRPGNGVQGGDATPERSLAAGAGRGGLGAIAPASG